MRKRKPKTLRIDPTKTKEAMIHLEKLRSDVEKRKKFTEYFQGLVAASLLSVNPDLVGKLKAKDKILSDKTIESILKDPNY